MNAGAHVLADSRGRSLDECHVLSDITQEHTVTLATKLLLKYY